MGSEQRRQKRIRYAMPVHVRRFRDGDTLESEEQGRLYDLSAGGCAFYFPQEIPIGERIQVRIVLADLLARKFMKPELTARGAVCRIERHGDQFLLGIRFLK